MTKFILVRHGEPTYDEVTKLGFKGGGLDLAPLTKKGIEEVTEISKNEIFKDSDILISSAYTRAMQTASIIANKWDLDINVEVLLHEWLPDLSFNYKTTDEFHNSLYLALKEWKEYQKNPNFSFSTKRESFKQVRARALSVLEKYSNYEKVIVVAHQLLISTLLKDGTRIKTGDFITVTSEELEENFDFQSKKLKKH